MTVLHTKYKIVIIKSFLSKSPISSESQTSNILSIEAAPYLMRYVSEQTSSDLFFYPSLSY